MLLNENLERILEITESITKEKDYTKLLTRILEDGMEISNADGGTLYLLDEDKLNFFFMITKSKGIKKGGLNEKIELPPVDINSQSVASYSARTKKIVNVSDVYKDSIFNWEGPKKYDKLNNYHTESVLVLPLLDRDSNVLGVMQLINATENDKIIPFSKEVERIIYSLSSLSSVLLNNMRLYENIKELLDSFVSAMVKAIESRTPYNAFHTINVANIASSFVDYINEKNYYFISKDKKEELVLACMLHDVGKLIVPLEILNKAKRFEGSIDMMNLRYELIDSCIKNNYLENKYTKDEYEKEKSYLDKIITFINRLNDSSFLSDDDLNFINEIKDKKYDTPYGELEILKDNELECALIRRGTLTQAERLEIEKHVVYTNEILKEIKFGKKYSNVKNIAASHHEYLNGTGYPNKLKDSDLSILVRIITIVDIYESLVSTDRPYKKPMPNERALSILNEMANKEGKLDKRLVEIFIEFKS